MRKPVTMWQFCKQRATSFLPNPFPLYSHFTTKFTMLATMIPSEMTLTIAIISSSSQIVNAHVEFSNAIVNFSICQEGILSLLQPASSNKVLIAYAGTPFVPHE